MKKEVAQKLGTIAKLNPINCDMSVFSDDGNGCFFVASPPRHRVVMGFPIVGATMMSHETPPMRRARSGQQPPLLHPK
jgi:hypothetical protein